MAVSLKVRNALDAAAAVLCELLPYSGSSKWKGHVNVCSIAARHGLAHYCAKMSKRPAVAALLERVWEHTSYKLEPLILDVVKEGLTYRRKSNHPVVRSEIEQLAAHLLEAGLRIPDLFDTDFLANLERSDSARAAESIRKDTIRTYVGTVSDSTRANALDKIRDDFFGLRDIQNRPEAGLRLERILTALFDLDGLAPRGSFKVIGEQIDGSFIMDHETYLLESKWTQGQVPEADLLVFRGKIEGKSQFTRGVFVSINGYSMGAIDAITRGKQPNFFLVDGMDLTCVCLNQITLPDLLRRKLRLLNEQGRVLVPAKELLS